MDEAFYKVHTFYYRIKERKRVCVYFAYKKKEIHDTRFWRVRSVLYTSISGSICDSSSIQFILYIFWHSSIDHNSINTLMKFICFKKKKELWEKFLLQQQQKILPILCHLATQLSLGCIKAITLFFFFKKTAIKKIHIIHLK